jgi:hypothetical protein
VRLRLRDTGRGVWPWWRALASACGGTGHCPAGTAPCLGEGGRSLGLDTAWYTRAQSEAAELAGIGHQRVHRARRARGRSKGLKGTRVKTVPGSARRVGSSRPVFPAPINKHQLESSSMPAHQQADIPPRHRAAAAGCRVQPREAAEAQAGGKGVVASAGPPRRAPADSHADAAAHKQHRTPISARAWNSRLAALRATSSETSMIIRHKRFAWTGGDDPRGVHGNEPAVWMAGDESGFVGAGLPPGA